jgi:branched-chain amino acid transport system ATP-binding protein
MSAAAPLLHVQDVSKSFGSLAAVRNVSLTVAAGELRAIIGPNGAGKTTFFNLITGYFPPSAGEIVLDGRTITREPAQRRVKLGMARTFQVTEIFPELTVWENLRVAAEAGVGLSMRAWFGREQAAILTRQIDEVIDLADLGAKADRPVGELAHGDQRATEIAMALALRPRLLLLDEPTAGMGDEETYRMASLIRRLHRDKNYTIVLIEHDMRVVFHLADRITVLDRGRLLADGAPHDIAQDEAVQAAYLGNPV